MDPHKLVNLLKRPIFVETIAIEIEIDYIYEVFLENHESKNYEIYKVIHHSLLNEKHDCHAVSINSMNISCANDHDWDDNHDGVRQNVEAGNGLKGSRLVAAGAVHHGVI